MKRLLILLLLVPILALTMISCDAEIRSSLAGFMGGFNGNLYADAGLFEVKTVEAKRAAATVASIGSEDVNEGNPTESFGITVNIPADVRKILNPQGAGVQKDLKDDLADAFNSKEQTDALLTELKKPASTEQQEAAVGTIAVFNATLVAFKTKLDDGSGGSDFDAILDKLELPSVGDGSSLTQGDLLNLQLMTNLISNTIGTLTDVGNTVKDDDGVGLGLGLDGIGDADFTSADNVKLIFKVIDDILFASKTAGDISSSTNYNFMGDINLGELMDSFRNEV